MFKILIADKLAQEGIDLINSIDDFEAVVRTGLSEDELVEIIGDYDGLIVRSATTVTPKILANSGKLKGIARAGVGVDNIDIPAATQKGILVMNTPGGNTLSAAEHTMALMLSLSRNVVQAGYQRLTVALLRVSQPCNRPFLQIQFPDRQLSCRLLHSFLAGCKYGFVLP